MTPGVGQGAEGHSRNREGVGGGGGGLDEQQPRAGRGHLSGEHLLGMCQAPGSIPRTERKRKEKGVARPSGELDTGTLTPAGSHQRLYQGGGTQRPGVCCGVGWLETLGDKKAGSSRLGGPGNA